MSSQSLSFAAAAIFLLLLSSACTVRLELASPRAAPGDLAAGSTGLTGHGRWFEGGPATSDRPSFDGVAIADIQAIDQKPRLLVRLPGRSGRSAKSDPDWAEGARIAAARLMPIPPPVKPSDVALTWRGERRSQAGSEPLRLRSTAPARDSRHAPPATAPQFGPTSRPVTLRPPPAKPRSWVSNLWQSGRMPPPAELVLAPDVELVRPGWRDDLAWLALVRPEAIAPAAGPSTHGREPPPGKRSVPLSSIRFRSLERVPAEPIRLFPMAPTVAPDFPAAAHAGSG